MNILKHALIAGGCAVVLTLGTNTAVAQQGRGNFDPAQMRQRQMDSLRESLEIKDDAEWTALEPKVSKVMDAERDLMADRMRGFFGGGNRRRGGDNAGDDNGGQQRRAQRGGFGGEPSAALTALQKAIDDKAPTAEIKAKLKAVQDEIKVRQAKLTAAREDLRSVLTPRQEAIATVRGILQ